MISYPRILLSYVLAGLFCLGVWFINPVQQTPPVLVHATTSVGISAELARELKQREIDIAAMQSAKLYRLYSCPTTLAYPTAERAVAYRVPARLATAVVIVESTCNPNAISKAGATGLMQVMPKLHHVSRRALLNRDTNLDVGIRYLSYLLRTYGVEDGTAYYFGVSPGSDAGWDYAYHVMSVAGYKVR